jgi:hypothetical protein
MSELDEQALVDRRATGCQYETGTCLCPGWPFTYQGCLAPGADAGEAPSGHADGPEDESEPISRHDWGPVGTVWPEAEAEQNRDRAAER